MTSHYLQAKHSIPNWNSRFFFIVLINQIPPPPPLSSQHTVGILDILSLATVIALAKPNSHLCFGKECNGLKYAGG